MPSFALPLSFFLLNSNAIDAIVSHDQSQSNMWDDEHNIVSIKKQRMKTIDALSSKRNFRKRQELVSSSKNIANKIPNLERSSQSIDVGLQRISIDNDTDFDQQISHFDLQLESPLSHQSLKSPLDNEARKDNWVWENNVNELPNRYLQDRKIPVAILAIVAGVAVAFLVCLIICLYLCYKCTKKSSTEQSNAKTLHVEDELGNTPSNHGSNHSSGIQNRSKPPISVIDVKESDNRSIDNTTLGVLTAGRKPKVPAKKIAVSNQTFVSDIEADGPATVLENKVKPRPPLEKIALSTQTLVSALETIDGGFAESKGFTKPKPWKQNSLSSWSTFTNDEETDNSFTSNSLTLLQRDKINFGLHMDEEDELMNPSISSSIKRPPRRENNLNSASQNSEEEGKESAPNNVDIIPTVENEKNNSKSVMKPDGTYDSNIRQSMFSKTDSNDDDNLKKQNQPNKINPNGNDFPSDYLILTPTTQTRKSAAGSIPNKLVTPDYEYSDKTPSPPPPPPPSPPPSPPPLLDRLKLNALNLNSFYSDDSGDHSLRFSFNSVESDRYFDEYETDLLPGVEEDLESIPHPDYFTKSTTSLRSSKTIDYFRNNSIISNSSQEEPWSLEATSALGGEEIFENSFSVPKVNGYNHASMSNTKTRESTDSDYGVKERNKIFRESSTYETEGEKRTRNLKAHNEFIEENTTPTQHNLLKLTASEGSSPQIANQLLRSHSDENDLHDFPTLVRNLDINDLANHNQNGEPNNHDSVVGSIESSIEEESPHSSVSFSQVTQRRINVVVPPGKIGIFLANRLDKKGTIVAEVRSSSSLYMKVFEGDKIVQIDGVDVSRRTVSEVSALMAAKAGVIRTLGVVTCKNLDEV